MGSIEDKGCVLKSEEKGGGGGSSSCMMFDLRKGGGAVSRPSPHHRSSMGKPTPSKWDDAQKWIVNLSRTERNEAKGSPRDSNADDRHLMGSASWAGDDYKNIVESVCLRDMGTDMTPIGSKEPSRAATPIRATSPDTEPRPTAHFSPEGEGVMAAEPEIKIHDINPFESRAAAWEEAQRAKYTASYKRQEMRIQAWENHQKNKAEMENRKAEVKAEQLKSRAKEKCNQKIATSRRIAQEKRAVAEAKLNDNAINTSQTGDYMRRNGHLPSSFSFNLPSCCW